MSNIIEFFDRKVKFKVVVSEYNRGEENLIYKRALIVINDLKTNKNYIHDFSEFILKNYRNKSIKTQIDYANIIARFLNYIKDKEIVKNFKLLDFEDLRCFLQYMATKVSKETINRNKRVLLNFYHFLSKKNFLENINLDDFSYVKKVIDGYEKIYLDRNFNIDMPYDYNDQRMSHKITESLQAMFLEIAFEEVNRIALGVAIQMFGGLRVGEIVNLSYSGIETVGVYGKYGLVLNIKNRTFRNDLSLNQGKGYVKKERIQQVFSPFNIIGKLFKLHTKKYKSKNIDSLFINKDRNPMSYESYYYHFNKIKKIFLKKLSASENPQLKIQSIIWKSKRWNTHIGRGIFTNSLIEGGASASIVQVLRGDESMQSFGTYVEESRKLNKKIEEIMDDSFRRLSNKL